MWSGTPEKVLVGVEVSYIRVSTRKPLFFLDANSMLPPRMREPENVRAYLPVNRMKTLTARESDISPVKLPVRPMVVHFRFALFIAVMFAVRTPEAGGDLIEAKQHTAPVHTSR